uniref:Uncharacterized protein n=1 Tax=Nelumbo nucifera TaxID=4432 RepID=A0A822Y8C6_NELNU|nr:TPA_asm: hypothetical protein HUJ06_029289 [Nelumbo nucifera]
MSESKCHGCTKLQEHIILLKEINKHRGS